MNVAHLISHVHLTGILGGVWTGGSFVLEHNLYSRAAWSYGCVWGAGGFDLKALSTK